MSNMSIPDRFKKAIRLEKSRNYKNAFQEYLSIINENSRFRNAYINLGSLCSRMNNFNEALKYYKAALSLGSDYLTLFNIGCIFYKTGRYAKAAENLEQSIAMNKTFVLSKLVAGLSYSRMNTLEKAEHYFSEVLKSHPRSRLALIALAVIYYQTGRLELSLKLLDGILRTDPGDINIRELKADILLKTGAIDESVSEIKAIKRRADKYKYFDEFIQSVPVEIYTDRYGSIDEKIDSLNARINEDSNNLISLSLCYLLKGDTDTAIDYLFNARKN
jgi:tetratricopeptide (TPR) repeat protein